MVKISVIIPVYNVEKYIDKCLGSLAEQSMQDFEIIIVNDGTKDHSEEVIKKYIESHKNLNIKYVKKENGGLASARNYGLKYATGKYISFLDADDYLDKDLFEKLDTYINNDIDVIKFKLKTVDEKGNLLEKVDGPVFEKCTGEEAYKKLCTQDLFMDPACIYLYRREYFIENKFEYRLRYHEDFGLTSLVIVNSKTFVSTDVYGYNYVQSDESLTRSINYEKDVLRAKDVLNHYDNMIEKIKKYDIKNETKDLVKRYYSNSVLLKAGTLKENEQKEYIKEIRKRKMYKNIKPYNIKQLIKRIILMLNVKLYLKMR